MRNDFNMNATEAIKELVEELNLNVEKLTRSQVATLILKMAKSGDLMRHAVVHEGFHGQSVDYVPYREVKALRAEVAKLHRKLQLIHKALHDT